MTSPAFPRDTDRVLMEFGRRLDQLERRNVNSRILAPEDPPTAGGTACEFLVMDPQGFGASGAAGTFDGGQLFSSGAIFEQCGGITWVDSGDYPLGWIEMAVTGLYLLTFEMQLNVSSPAATEYSEIAIMYDGINPGLMDVAYAHSGFAGPTLNKKSVTNCSVPKWVNAGERVYPSMTVSKAWSSARPRMSAVLQPCTCDDPELQSGG